MLDGAASPETALKALGHLGLESVALHFWKDRGATDLGRLSASLGLAMEAAAVPGQRKPVVSALSCYGNALGGGEEARRCLSTIKDLIAAAPAFGAPVVGCFAGRLPGRSVPDSIEAWKAAFGPLAEEAQARGITIAFENCRLGDSWKTGNWNIAINPDAWALMFDALPGAPLALEWEPSHQLLSLADPLVQLGAWVHKVAHVHAKDARIDHRALGLHGIHGSTKAGVECLPGEGDTDWRELFSILSSAGYRGSVDVEIGAIAAYQGAREAEGIEKAVNHLRASYRGA